MKMLITTLLMIFSLSACRSFEQQIICKEIDSYQIKPTPLCDISFQFNRCRCRCLYLKNDLQTVDPKKCGLDWAENVKDFPIEHCEGIAGFFVEDIAKHIRPEALETKQCFEDSCGGK